ncbi:putative adenine methylase from phage origin [Escherichia coli]|uniref:Putative adenine methylase from phage origin n=1 Tax=Escherichia coli TaxID=562 RepID=A0A2X1MNB9_ECOLX|nr:putative adenine methylase from phage origin [Escherichia coli]
MTMKGFTWKQCGSRQPDKLVMGMGHMTRANSEDCLFAVKGNYRHVLMRDHSVVYIASSGAFSEA